MACFPTWAKREGEGLAEVLQRCIALEEIHPDSLFPALRMLERKRTEAVRAEERAMYSTALGVLYHLRQYRSQSQDQRTEAPQDSIEEWSRARYVRASRECFSQALSDKELLFSMSTREWMPLVSRGRDEDLFGRNMLYVVWTAMRESGVASYEVNGNERSQAPLPTFAEMIAFYQEHNLREAALLMEMDSVDAGPWKNRRTALERIARDYADLNLSAKVLEQLVLEPQEGKDWNSREQREYRYNKLSELLRQYPKYRDAASLRNGMLQAQQPEMEFEYQELVYTGSETRIPYKYNNVNRLNFKLYRLPDAFDEDELMCGNRVKDWLNKHARQMESRDVKAKAGVMPFESVRDTLQLTIAEHGRYALLVQAETKMKLEERPECRLILLRATHLLPVQLNIKDKARVMVLDALSGKPQQGVKVMVEWEPAGGRLADTVRSTLMTDERGIVEVPAMENRRPYATFEQGHDRFSPRLMLNARKTYVGEVETEYTDYRIFTDRSIYRPGQPIEMSAVAYNRKGWDARTLEGRRVEVTLRDPESKMLIDTTLVTDEFGTLACSLPLQPASKPGLYRLMVNNVARLVSVEEYKRPTFEVRMDEPMLDAPSSGHPQLMTDSITFTGRALTYAGVPVRQARVTGEYRWRDGWLKRVGSPYHAPERTDTIWTDDEGRFTLRVPNRLSVEEMKWGSRLTLSVDVLNNNGETHSGEASTSVCSTPLRLRGDVGEMQDKQRLKPCRFELVNALDKEVEGEVKVQLVKGEDIVLNTTLAANKKQSIKGMEDVPSGAYTLRAQVVMGSDTASWKQRVVVFSAEDNQLPVDTTHWFYMPVEDFTEGRPAHIQVGSSLQDVTVYYIVSTQRQVYTDSLFTLSGGVKQLTIPYQEGMQKGASVLLCFVKDNHLYTQNFDLLPLQPDYRLKTRWTSFRDRVRPGEHEKWSLQILRPDGTPARANLLATLYDASLDALRSHSLDLNISRSYRFNGLYPRAELPVNYTTSIYFPLKMYTPYAWIFSRLDDRYFQVAMPKRYGSVGNKLMMATAAPKARMVKAKGTAIPEHEISFSTKGISAKDFEGLGITSVDEALQGRIAGLDIVKTAELGTGAMSLRGSASYGENLIEEGAPADWSALRTNFNETAFFMPQLRTEKEGQVTLDFTLPESLTRWHLLGLAHTQDLLTAQLDEGIVAQKELMAQLFLPRFLRVGDKAELTATIQNICEVGDDAAAQDGMESGQAVFEILNAKTEKVVLRRKVDFSLRSQQDTVFYFPYDVKDPDMDLICRWVANGQHCSDGEQRLIPVLTDRERLTRTKAVTLMDKGVTELNLQHLFPKGATHQQLTVEYTTHPVWAAIQSLPTLQKTPHDDLLSLVASYYASTLCLHLCQENEKIRNYLEGVQEDSLRLSRTRVLNKVIDLQLPNGAFMWFPGMMPNDYLTREVAFQLARLNDLLGREDADTRDMLEKALGYMRKSLQKDMVMFTDKRYRDAEVSTSMIHHLYVVSIIGKEMDANEKLLVKELGKKSEWGLEDHALASIVLHIQDKNRDTKKMMEHVKHYLVGTPEKGRYIDYAGGTFYSIDHKIRVHTRIMEAVKKTCPDDEELWRGMRHWLLQEKRTTDWSTPINTVDAVYALLSADKGDLVDEAQDVLDVRGKGKVQRLTSPDTHKGYLKKEIDVDSPKSLTITKRSEGESWGAVYAQFEQQMDSVSAAWQGIHIRREVSNLHPKVGDRIHVRYVIKATMDCEYVLLHAPRPASTEPGVQVSGYGYSNGLGYYRTVKDAATDYYICNLPKGTYVLEEDWLVEREGSYHAGVTTVECLYAPEFRAYTNNVKLVPKK